MSYIWRTRHPMVRRQRYLDQQKALRIAKHEEYKRKHGVYPTGYLLESFWFRFIIAIPLTLILMVMCAKR